jgi:hypothetical protein
VCKRIQVILILRARPTIAHEAVMIELPRPQRLVLRHVTVRKCDLFTSLNVVDDMYRLLPDRRVPRKVRIRVAGVVEARSVREDGGTSTHLHAVRLEDADEGNVRCHAGFVLLDYALELAAVDGFVNAGGPFLSGAEILGRFLDVGLEIVRDGNDEERVVGEDAGAALEVLEGEAAVAFGGDGADLVEWVLWNDGQFAAS